MWIATPLACCDLASFMVVPRELLVACLGPILFTGCISMHMAQASPPQVIQSTPDRATVVFVRARQAPFREGQIVTVIDTDGHFLGEVNDGDHFALTLPPGRRAFVGFFRESADLIEADLAAGHVYYVLLSMAPGTWHATVSMRTLRREGSEWPGRSELLWDTRQLVPLINEGQAALGPREARRKIRNAQRRWATYSHDERRTHTLSPGDGERVPELPSEDASNAIAGASLQPSHQLGIP